MRCQPLPGFSTGAGVEHLAAIGHVTLVTKLLSWKGTRLLARCCTQVFSSRMAASLGACSAHSSNCSSDCVQDCTNI